MDHTDAPRDSKCYARRRQLFKLMISDTWVTAPGAANGLHSPETNMTRSIESPSDVRTVPLRNGQVGFSFGPCQVRTYVGPQTRLGSHPSDSLW